MFFMSLWTWKLDFQMALPAFGKGHLVLIEIIVTESNDPKSKMMSSDPANWRMHGWKTYVLRGHSKKTTLVNW